MEGGKGCSGCSGCSCCWVVIVVVVVVVVGFSSCQVVKFLLILLHLDISFEEGLYNSFSGQLDNSLRTTALADNLTTAFGQLDNPISSEQLQ